MGFSKAKASACILALLFSTSALAESRLVSPPVEGYFVANEASDATQYIREEIPEGETLTTWTSMITHQRFTGVDVTALQFAQAMDNGVTESCPNLAKGQPAKQVHQGFEAASFSATCYPEDDSDKPETFFMLIIRAPDALLVKQVAFRDDITNANMQLAVKLLLTAVVCDEDCPVTAE